MGKGLRAIFTSDWHLDALSNLFPSDGLELQLYEIEKIYLYASENGIDTVFNLGDISDSSKMSDEAEIGIVRLMLKYPDITTYYLLGNHDHGHKNSRAMDMISELCSLGVIPNLKIMNKAKRFKVKGIPFNAIPFGESKKLMKREKGAVNLVHMDISGAKENNRTLKGETLDYFGGSVVVGGHIHEYQVLKNGVYLCGNPMPKRFNETAAKGFIDANVTLKGQKIRFEHDFIVNSCNYSLETLTVKTAKDLSKFSNVTNVRYKVLVRDDVVLPSDIRIQYPSIYQILGQGSPKVNETKTRSEHKTARLNPLTGLAKQCKASGYGKKDFIFFKQEVESALAKLK